MPKLILRCNYLKNSPPAHLANYINYIGTREGVEKVGSTTSSLPATDRQKSLIEDILAKIPDANRMHEYHDYIQRPTRENASEFITQALENNLDIIAKKKNYMDYLANRPGVEIIGTHGLFSNEGEPVVLSRVAEEVANHPGVIWTNVISLRREDAERLGYDSAAQWQALLRGEADRMQWHMPIGYKVVDGKITICEEQRKIVEQIFTDYDSGVAAGRIAQNLKGRNICNAKGKVSWTHASIGRILENPSYLGTEYYPQLIGERAVLQGTGRDDAEGILMQGGCHPEEEPEEQVFLHLCTDRHAGLRKMRAGVPESHLGEKREKESGLEMQQPAD